MAVETRPRRSRPSRRLPLVLGAALLALVVAAVAVWYFVIRSDSPSKLSLSSTPTSVGPAAPGSLTGTWVPGPMSVAGYRMREKLASIPAPSEAVGRTSSITGEVRVEESGTKVTVPSARFEVNVQTLKSDQSRRDSAIKRSGLETDKFPAATFVTTQPIQTDTTANKVDATGDLTLHGVTKRVTIPLDVRLNGNQIEMVGAIAFPCSDFGMQPPSIAGFVTVESQATMEVSLVLTKKA